MNRVLGLAGACIAASLVLSLPSAAQDRKPAAPPASHTHADMKKAHRVVLQVNANEAGTMNLTLNNATNIAQYYGGRGEKVEIEIVTFGPGLHMLRDDTSPVKQRIKAITEKTPNITFKACANTQENMRKVEDKDIPLIPEAKIVSSGVVHIIELQEQGWSYVRP